MEDILIYRIMALDIEIGQRIVHRSATKSPQLDRHPQIKLINSICDMYNRHGIKTIILYEDEKTGINGAAGMQRLN